jgi:hypothetical protein
MRWLTTEERETQIILTANIDPRQVSDRDLLSIGEEITQAVNEMFTGSPVILAGNWPLWAIARAARLVYPKAAWIGVDIGGGTVVVVSSGQEDGAGVSLAAVRNGTYAGEGPCTLNLRQTSDRGVYRLEVVHPTPARPIDGHTKVDLHAVKRAIETLEPPSDLHGVLITGNAWRVVIAMLANSSALRKKCEVEWCAVDEPRRDYAVMAWGSQTGGQDRPGSLVPRDGVPKQLQISSPTEGLVRRAGRWWRGLSEAGRIAIITTLIAGVMGLCGALYGPTIDLLFDRPEPTATPVVTATNAPPTTATPTPP